MQQPVANGLQGEAVLRAELEPAGEQLKAVLLGQGGPVADLELVQGHSQLQALHVAGQLRLAGLHIVKQGAPTRQLRLPAEDGLRFGGRRAQREALSRR